MNSNNFRMPARRSAALATAAALTAAPLALGTGTAHAATGQGRASAAVLRTALDVSLLNRTVNVPLAVSFNEVQAPRSADRTALSVRLDGVDGGKPFTVVGADVAESKATATARRAEGSVRVAHARLHVPGLPLLSLIEAETITARATCAAGQAPTAEANVLGTVTVLGKRVTLTAGGPVEVKVPGVGEVRLDLSRHTTTTRTAAATALGLKVSVNPLKLNVAEVEGTVTLAEATCESPTAPPATKPAPGHEPAAGTRPQGTPSETSLAETGGDSTTPYIAGGALALLLAGGGALTLARRRKH
ncbi:SCO1860 family LAETG-anchored protein [Streptomyces rubradiris]|uniref:LPXTG cell wall anchor domain-containing protein n=1 Tax=Streptomyces rubradiris TaxID=285531 RepID=A0ABQ3R6R9_STRRR|nr:SCO1860 family LAETG-anchored protein [Streptomyces rubradiris]GHH25222.1 LPXTG cell wall anchor domain-containing protein [Streptomyces rubradiris]GHI51552.1 LPXTG cell wall anchor domain-containing protein [Streptomyces rubradiris]